MNCRVILDIITECSCSTWRYKFTSVSSLPNKMIKDDVLLCLHFRYALMYSWYFTFRVFVLIIIFIFVAVDLVMYGSSTIFLYQFRDTYLNLFNLDSSKICTITISKRCTTKMALHNNIQIILCNLCTIYFWFGLFSSFIALSMSGPYHFVSAILNKSGTITYIVSTFIIWYFPS